MTYQLEFKERQQYSSLEIGITLETTLRHGDLEVHFMSNVDTGSHYCLFRRTLGEQLGLDIENGTQIELGTLVGTFTAFGHEMTLETLGLTFHTAVYFPQSYEIRRNILGRQGWLQLVKLGLIDYDSEIYLSPYNEET